MERDFARCGRLAEEGAAATTDADLRASCLALAGRVRHAVGDLTGARVLLDEVATEAPASLSPVVDLWRGFLLVHSGQVTPALKLVSREPAQARVGYPFAAINRHMVAGYAEALRGQPAAALREFDRMAAAAARESTERFAGRDENFRGWVLRGVGAMAEADDANTAAYEQSRTRNLAEPMTHALLDLADGRLRAGDPDGAARHLDALGEDDFLFRWRTQLRAALIRGRWALAVDRPADAVDLFDEVRVAAERLDLARYLVQARLWGALARHRGGERLPARALSGDIQALESVAPLEAWWLTAELAETWQVDRWRAVARDRVDRLAAHAGTYAETLRSVADRTLSRRT